MAEVCILITVYNGAPWIDEALDSALAQRDVDFEVLVVDDGSTDTTPEILERRRQQVPDKIRVLRIPQSGLSKARNFAFDNIEAEFTTALDADDRMHPRRARLECDALRVHPEARLSFAARWSFEDGRDVGSFGFGPDAFGASSESVFTRLDDALSAMLEAGEYPGTDACTVRTEWAREHGRFNEELRSFVDGERWLRTLHSHPVVYVAAPLYQRRVHSQSMSAASVDASNVLFSVMDEMHQRWHVYSPRQKSNLSAFEIRAGVWLGRRAGIAGDRAAGRRFLLEHRKRLMSPSWARTMAYLITPPALRDLWRAVKPRGTAAEQDLVPLSAITIDDIESIWNRPTQSAAAMESSR